MKKIFLAKAKAKAGELYIYDSIGADYFGGIGAQDVAKALADIGNVDTLNVYLNSPGGSVFEGVAIYNQLKRFNARKVIHVDGLAASIASVILMAGDERRIAKNGQVMIHDPYGFCFGTAEDMEKNAVVLKQIKATILGTYVDRAKCSEKECERWMTDETWMTASVALERGFVDAIEETDADAENFVDSLLAKFKNTPNELKAAALATNVLLAKMSHRTAKLRLASQSA